MKGKRRLLHLPLFIILLFAGYLSSSAFVSFRMESFVNNQRLEWAKKGWKVSPLQWRWNIWKWTFYGVIPQMTIPLSEDAQVFVYWLEVTGCVLCRNRIRSVDVARLSIGKKEDDWIRLEKVHAISSRPGEWIARGQAIFGKNYPFFSRYPADFWLDLEQERGEMQYDFRCVTREKYVYEGLGRLRLSPFLPVSAMWVFQRAPYRGRLLVAPRDEHPELGYRLRFQIQQWEETETSLDARITAEAEKQEMGWVIRGNLQGKNIPLGPVRSSSISLDFWTEERLTRWESDGKIGFPLPRGFFFSLEELPVHLSLHFQPAGVLLSLSGKIPEAQNRLIEKNIAEIYRTFLPAVSSLHPSLEWKSEILYEKGAWRFPLFAVDVSIPDGEGKIQFAFTPEKFTVNGAVKTEEVELSAVDRGDMKIFQAVVHPHFLSHFRQMFPEGFEPLAPVTAQLNWNVRRNEVNWLFFSEKVAYQGQVFASFQAEVKGNDWKFHAENPPLDAHIFQDSAGCHYAVKTANFPLRTSTFSATVESNLDALLPSSPCIFDAHLFSPNTINLLDISGGFTLHHLQFQGVLFPDMEWEVEKKGERAQGTLFIHQQKILWSCENLYPWQCQADAEEWDFSPLLSPYFPQFPDIFPAPVSFHISFQLKRYLPGKTEFSTFVVRYQNILWKEIKGNAVWDEKGISIDATAFPEGAEEVSEPVQIHLDLSYDNLKENLLPVFLKIAFPEGNYPLSPGISIVSSGEFRLILDLSLPGGRERREKAVRLRAINGQIKNPLLKISIGQRSLSFSSAERVSLTVNSEGAVVLPPVLLIGDAGKIEILGGKFFPEQGGWTGSLECTLNIPARILELYFPKIFLEGDISARATLTLKGDEWSISAKRSGQSLSFSPPSSPLLAFRDASVDWEIQGDILRLNRFSALFSGGLVEGDGEVLMKEKEARMNLRTTAFWLDFSPALEAKIAGNATLTLTPEGGFLWGSASVVKGTISLESLPVMAPAEFPYPLSLSFRLDIPTGVTAEGESYRFHPSGFLYFTGSYHSPRLYGTMQMQEGDEISLLGKTFHVEEGLLEWFGSLFNPRWHISASRREYPYLFTAIIDGSPEKPEVSFLSDPPLASTDILAFLLTGRTLQEMGGEAGDIFAIALPAYLSTQIPSRVLERISIVPFTSRTGQKKNFLLIGKSLGEGIFITHAMDLESGSESFTDVRWNFLPSWEAHFVRDTSQKLGGQLSYRSFLRSRPPPVYEKLFISSFLWDSNLPPDIQANVEKIPSREKYAGEEEECRKILRFLQMQGYLRANCEAERQEGTVHFRIRSGDLFEIELLGLREQETSALKKELMK
ncbi:MAG: translocation/assembly module TamB domain-containing protein, partial [bacterium]